MSKVALAEKLLSAIDGIAVDCDKYEFGLPTPDEWVAKMAAVLVPHFKDSESDDAEPFTVEWFEAAYHGEHCTIYSSGPPGAVTATIGLQHGVLWRRTRVPAGSTRGDVRRFLAWQGVPGKTRNSESEGS